MSIEKLSIIWPEWKVVELIGEGSFGKVYKIVRDEHGVTSYAAVKVISIPQNDAELNSLRAEGFDATGTRSYFEGVVTDFVNEIKLMESVKGTSNIVSVEDYKVLEKTDIIGWDIFIRMELLTSFIDYTADRKLTEAEVIKLGQDVCSALELCAHKNIIHRDIKPENIFVSSFGDFKVGDFGIARELEKTSASLSSKGTYNYMAPEVMTLKQYDATVDIYSLGLVLYKLLNNNRLPFLDPNAQLLQYQDRKNAIDRRFSGEALPEPVNASPQMAQVILTACAFNPSNRFKNPTAFKNALGQVRGVAPTPVAKSVDVGETHRVHPEAQHNSDSEKNKPINNKKNKKNKKKKILIPIMALLCVVGIIIGISILKPNILDGITHNNTAKVISALEGGEYSEALSLVGDTNEKSLRSKLESRLDTLESEFRKGNIEHSVIQMELDTIDKMNVSGLNRKLGGIRESIGEINSEKVIMALESSEYTEAVSIVKDANENSLRSKLEDRLDTLESEFRNGNIEYSVIQMELDTIDKMNVSNLNSKLSNTRESINKLNDSQTAFSTAEALFDNGEYAEAINQYKKVDSDDSNYEKAKEGVSKTTAEYRKKTLATADEFAGKDDFENAIKTLSSALKTIENDSEINQQITVYNQKYKTKVLDDADKALKDEGYENAVKILKNALKVLENDVDIQAAIVTYEGYAPVWVVDVEPFYYSSGHFYQSNRATDNLGNTYNEGILTVSSTTNATYLLDGEYSKIKGTIIIKNDDKNKEYVGRVTIKDGDKTLYTSPDLGRGIRPIDFEIDISGVKELTIKINGSRDGWSDWFPTMVNTAFYK